LRDEGDKTGGGFDGRQSGVRETTAVSEAPNARAILHIADLEKIVSAVRAQALGGGRHEITIELRHSVLEGLRVKLSTSENGRLSAEFIAASERLRAQLDARAPELADILRARGVNLGELRTSVGAGDHRSAGDGGQPRWPAAAGDLAATPAGPVSQPDAEAADDSAEDGPGLTYRA
jgi:hypothetical protein